MKSAIRSPKSGQTTLVCFALKEEAAAFRKISAGRPGVAVLITGIGQENAKQLVKDFLVEHAPTLVLTCGLAGGLNPDLELGEVVFELFPTSGRGDEAQTEIGNRLEPPYVGCYERLITAGAKPARLFCADRIATKAVDKQELRRVTGADAVEMESKAIHAVCRERRIPCATVRVISDTANEDLPLDFNQLAKADLSLDYGKLALAVAKSPAKISALLRLQKQTRFAAERLAAVLGKVIWPP